LLQRKKSITEAYFKHKPNRQKRKFHLCAPQGSVSNAVPNNFDEDIDQKSATFLKIANAEIISCIMRLHGGMGCPLQRGFGKIFVFFKLT